MTLLDPQQHRLWRLPVSLSTVTRTVPESRVATVRRTIRRSNDVDLVRSAMIQRYAMRLQKLQDATGVEKTTLIAGTGTNQVAERIATQRNEAAYAALNAGIYELTRLYAADNIIDKTATRFSGIGANYEYDGDQKVEEWMSDIRSRAGVTLIEQQWDHISFACGSAVLYLSTVGDQMSYDIIWIDGFYWAFAEEIWDRDTETRRPTNTTDLDEASVVAIRLSGGADNLSRYAAWYGASERYPRGRHVRYDARSWYDIPDPGDGGLDYVWTGARSEYTRSPDVEQLANPLSLYQELHKIAGPEYPFVVLRGRPIDTDVLCPATGLSIWDLSAEYDVAASVALYAANKGAVGKEVLKQSDGSAGRVPDTVHARTTVLDRGWDLTVTGWGPAHAKSAMEVIADQVKMISEAYHVPSFLVAPDWSTFPSGIALRMARTDMDAYRDTTVEVARPAVRRRFDIERALVNLSEGKVAIGADVRETWNAGELRWPEEPDVEISVAQQRLQMGVDDLGDTVMKLRQLPSHEAAIRYLEERQQQAEQHEVLSGPQQQQQPQQPQTLRERLLARRGEAGNGQQQQR